MSSVILSYGHHVIWLSCHLVTLSSWSPKFLTNLLMDKQQTYRSALQTIKKGVTEMLLMTAIDISPCPHLYMPRRWGRWGRPWWWWGRRWRWRGCRAACWSQSRCRCRPRPWGRWSSSWPCWGPRSGWSPCPAGPGWRRRRCNGNNIIKYYIGYFHLYLSTLLHIYLYYLLWINLLYLSFTLDLPNYYLTKILWHSEWRQNKISIYNCINLLFATHTEQPVFVFGSRVPAVQ